MVNDTINKSIYEIDRFYKLFDGFSNRKNVIEWLNNFSKIPYIDLILYYYSNNLILEIEDQKKKKNSLELYIPGGEWNPWLTRYKLWKNLYEINKKIDKVTFYKRTVPLLLDLNVFILKESTLNEINRSKSLEIMFPKISINPKFLIKILPAIKDFLSNDKL